MSRFWTPFFIVFASLMIAVSGFAKPPSHAPAHGYRAKHKNHAKPPASAPNGVEIVFDSERGVSIAVGLPGVYFHAGQFYRRHDGGWQISVRADGGWNAVKGHAMPEAIRKAHARPGRAKLKNRKR